MRALTRRLQRLEATVARLDPLKRERDFEEFRRTAEEYIRAAREYLGEPPESEMTISCRNDGKMMPIINQIMAYRIRSFRHYYQRRIADAKTRGSDLLCWETLPRPDPELEWERVGFAQSESLSRRVMGATE